MIAKLFRVPEELGDPPSLSKSLGFDMMSAYTKACEDYTARVVEWAKKNSKTPDHDLIGYVYAYPIADGYAQYVVLNVRPIELLHLPIGDAWSIPDVVRRGLTIGEIRREQKRDIAIKELFGKKE